MNIPPRAKRLICQLDEEMEATAVLGEDIQDNVFDLFLVFFLSDRLIKLMRGTAVGRRLASRSRGKP